jgi:hypothetical protein
MNEAARRIIARFESSEDDRAILESLRGSNSPSCEFRELAAKETQSPSSYG